MYANCRGWSNLYHNVTSLEFLFGGYATRSSGECVCNFQQCAVKCNEWKCQVSAYFEPKKRWHEYRVYMCAESMVKNNFDYWSIITVHNAFSINLWICKRYIYWSFTWTIKYIAVWCESDFSVEILYDSNRHR